MNIYIKPNPEKPEALDCARRAAAVLLDISKKCGEETGIFFDADDKSYIGALDGASFGPPEDMLRACDIVMPVGGDGTIMRAAQSAAREGKPILGVNAGRVGFLTQAESGELCELERLFTGRYRLLDRMMLKASVEIGGKLQAFTALNDIVVRHGDSDRIVELEVRHGSGLVVSHRADGVIFSTPTGSTAYSMSAGGPIVSPELSLILVTAICPHSAFNCSLVLPPDQTYTVSENPAGAKHGMYVSVDGARVGRLMPGGAVTVSRSETGARFIDLGLREFFSNLNQKLSWRR